MSDFCDLMDRSLPGSSVHERSQARILEWIAIFFSIYWVLTVYLLLNYFFSIEKDQWSAFEELVI